MELILFLGKIISHFARQASETETDPLFQNLYNTHLSGSAVYQNIEVTFKIVLESGRKIEQLIHKLVGIGAAAKVDRKAKAVFVDLISIIYDILDLSALSQLSETSDNILNKGGIGDLQNVNAVSRSIVGISCNIFTCIISNSNNIALLIL